MQLKMHAIHLNFDAVLHTTKLCIHRQGGVYVQEPNHTLFEWMPILEESLAPYSSLTSSSTSSLRLPLTMPMVAGRRSTA